MDVPSQVVRKDVPERADAWLRGEVEDTVEPREVDGILGEVETAHVDVAGVLLLERPVVVIGEAVEPDDLMAGGQKGFRQM